MVFWGDVSCPEDAHESGHRQSINTHNVGVPVGDHFNRPGHSLGDLRVLVVAGGLPDIHIRKKREVSFITKFGTHLIGLNRDVGFASHYPSLLG